MGDLQDLIKGRKFEIGGDFHEQWAVGIDFSDRLNDFDERPFLLQISKAGSIGAGDVHDEVGAVLVEKSVAVLVVLGSIGQFGDLGFAEIYAHGDLGFAGGEAGRDFSGALVIESQSVDEPLVAGDSEHPGLWISGLGMPGDGSDLDEAEPELVPVVENQGVLVKSSGEAEGVFEFDSEILLLKNRVVEVTSLNPTSLKNFHP